MMDPFVKGMEKMEDEIEDTLEDMPDVGQHETATIC